MDEQEKRELNEKLARWAGLHYEECCDGGGWFSPSPDDDPINLPDYTSDLNAIFRDLVPKLKEQGYMLRVQFSPLYDNETGKQLSDWTGYATVSQVLHQYPMKGEHWGKDASPSLACAIAIGKLIEAK